MVPPPPPPVHKHYKSLLAVRLNSAAGELKKKARSGDRLVSGTCLHFDLGAAHSRRKNRISKRANTFSTMIQY